MLITVSGMVGSGKTTAAVHVQQLLDHDGVHVMQWRFQSLPCFEFLRSRSGRGGDGSQQPLAQRWTGYRRKRLTARVTVGYIARILAFRWFQRWRALPGCQISNRYFYDNFEHYELETPTERFYAALPQRLVPVPDLAILLVASPETIAARRPDYSTEYLSTLQEAYRNLHVRFPELVKISTDPGQPRLERLDAVLRERVEPAKRPRR